MVNSIHKNENGSQQSQGIFGILQKFPHRIKHKGLWQATKLITGKTESHGDK